MPISRFLGLAKILTLLIVPLLVGAESLRLGQDTNWDILNYHLYNPYAFLNNRLTYDLAPAGLQSFFNPAVDIAYYKALFWFGPEKTAFGLGFLQGLNFLLLYGVSKKLLAKEKWSSLISFCLAFLGILSVGFISEI